MRTGSILLIGFLVVSPATSMAGESLVNGSFEDGTLNGWTILSDSVANYHNPPIKQCICGGDVTPENPGAHRFHDLLLAPDGQYFAGLTWMQDAEPYDNLPHPGKLSRYLQTIHVANWNPGADRTNYHFEIWSQMAHSWHWNRHGQARQTYIIHWNNDGLAPRDTALVMISGDIYDSDTIEIDTGGANRVYEFDTDGQIRPTSNVAVVVPNPLATVVISGGILDGDTIELDTTGVNHVYEFDADGSVGAGHVVVDMSSAVLKATIRIVGNVADGDTIEIDPTGVNIVYEFDNNGVVAEGNVPVNGVGTYKTALNALSAKINSDPNRPYNASGRDGNNVYLTWIAPGGGTTNTNLNDANGTISVTNWGRDKDVAKSRLMNAINTDPTGPPFTAIDGGTNTIKLIWTGAAGQAATNTNLNDANNVISITDFKGIAKNDAKAALMAAINADPGALCTASDVNSIGDDQTRYIKLTWNTLNSGGATNSNLNDTFGRISVTNFSYFQGVCDNTYIIGDLDPMAFVKGSSLEFNNWRKIRLAGSIPDNPQAVVLEIRLEHEGNMSTTHNCFDGVVFSAESATGSAIGPFAGDIVNSDFELEPYNTQHYGFDKNVTAYPFLVTPHPFGWDALTWRWGGSGDGAGPIEGLTNGVTVPTNPLDLSTPSGEHFWGRANDPPLGTYPSNCEGNWGKLLPVRNWSPCATGIRWKLHYLTKIWNTHDMDPDWNSSYTLTLWWDIDDDARQYSIMDIPPNPSTDIRHHLEHGSFPWVKIVDMNDRAYPDARTRGLIEVEQEGEFAPTDRYGNSYAPEHVILRDSQWVWGWWDGTMPYRIAYDKVDFYVEAIVPTEVRIVTPPPLPAGDCDNLYSVQLLGCYEPPLTFSIVSGSLPPGLTLSPTGLISGRPNTAGTFAFTVQLEDGTSATTTKGFEIAVSGNCCGPISGDLDRDSDVDQRDFALLQLCYTGSDGGVPLPPEAPDCTCADLDKDGLDIDQSDLLVFEQCASGPGIPADPQCSTEACCLTDGSCVEMLPMTCSSLGGIPQGSGTTCKTASCP